MNCFRRQYEMILSEIRTAMDAVSPDEAEAFVEALLGAQRVFVIGIGRAMLSMQAMAKRLNHLGIEAYCVGDTSEPAITEQDLLVVGSGSGESAAPVAIAKVAKQHGARIAHIGSNPSSSLTPLADVFVRIPVRTKLKRPGEIQSKQIMTSLFEQALYVFADSIALLIAERRSVDVNSLWRRHANLE